MSVVAVLALATVSAGCATAPPGSRYIARPDTGPIEVAVDPPKARRLLDPKVLEAARLEAVRRRAAEPPPAVPTVEKTDAPLGAALAALAAESTPAAHVRVAQQYQRLRITDHALAHYDEALKREANLVAALDGRARTWRDLRLPGLALADALRARYHAPASPAVRNTLGTIHEALGQLDLARQEFAEALRLDPSAQYARENLDRLDRQPAPPAKAAGSPR